MHDPITERRYDRSMREGAEARRHARRHWPGEKLELGTLGDETQAHATFTPSERVAMVWQLTLDAWAMSDAALPSYTRAAMPGSMSRGSGPA
jgi:hypothetical protein